MASWFPRRALSCWHMDHGPAARSAARTNLVPVSTDNAKSALSASTGPTAGTASLSEHPAPYNLQPPPHFSNHQPINLQRRRLARSRPRALCVAFSECGASRIHRRYFDNESRRSSTRVGSRFARRLVPYSRSRPCSRCCTCRARATTPGCERSRSATSTTADRARRTCLNDLPPTRS
jgi:hypothetical protein